MAFYYKTGHKNPNLEDCMILFLRGVLMMKAWCLFSCLIIASFLPAVEESPDSDSGYIGSEQCGACHAEEFSLWQSSRHAAEPQYGPDQESHWVENCSGCHVTGIGDGDSGWKEKRIGCEACHGPGGGHVSNIGDESKIVSTISADVCGRCHARNPAGGPLMKDGTPWIEGYRPGMHLSEVPGLEMPPLEPSALPPPPVDNHPLIYNMWKASGHNRAVGRTFTIAGRDWRGPVTCVACHNPHNSEQGHQLVADPDSLCAACHTQNEVLKGKGAKGVEQTRGLHTAISCIECHMTEKNHLMRIIRPDNPELASGRIDTCSSCHEVKDRDVRAHQIQDWEAWYREAWEPVQSAMKAVDEALKNNPDLLNEEMKRKLQDTKNNLSIIELDGSGGVHNLDYALEIMALAKRDLAKIREAME